MANSDQANKNVSLSLIADYGGSDSESDTETQSNATGNDSDAPEFSEMVLKNNIINACDHGPLSRPMSDNEDITRHMIIDSSESGVVEYEVTEYRDLDSISDSSSSSDSDVDSVKDIEEASSGDEFEGSSRGGKVEPPKVNGELGLDDLPPIEDLAISLPAQQCTQIGVVASIVDRLVIVSAFAETPAVDLDSILFLDNGAKALGKVFDVFGPVTQPHYCVRFNSAEHVRERGVTPGMQVFIAPQSQHTNYVFLAELMKMKGSDASWLNDIEPPPHQVEYSDDEEERKAKKEQKQKQSEENGETSSNVRKILERRPRPSDSRSHSNNLNRGRNPFSAGSRRTTAPFPRLTRPSYDVWTPNPHPNDPGGYPASLMAPGGFYGPPLNPPMPPFGMFNFGSNPRVNNPMRMPPPFRQNMPIFGSNFCTGQPRWMNGPPPPTGT